MQTASTLDPQHSTPLQEVRNAIPASRLSVWCDRVIEMAWLAAIIVVPLFFNIYSSRVFEPDKLTTLRSIAIVACVAWLVKWLEERNNPNRDTRVNWRTPLVLPTLITVIVYMVSTAFSVAPRTSLLGSYQRLQGTYTTLSYIVMFFMVLQGLRTRAQLERLITVIIVTALPVSIYGVLQRQEIDPLPWGGDTVQRVASNMGNSIFVAAYLIMTFFLNVYKIVDAVLAILRSERERLADVVRAAAYIVILLINAYVVLVLAGSRGPQLGWFAGLFFFVILMVQLLRRRSLRIGLTIVSIVGMIAGASFLVWLNIDKTNPTALQLRKAVPLFERMSSVINTSEGTNLVRALIWEGVVALVSPHAPLEKPDGTKDEWNAIRPLIGYGPESMYVAYNRFYPPGLANIEARNASPDRSHNETWDSLVITGVLGFLAYMFLFLSVLYFAMRYIGLIRNQAEGWLFVALWVIGAGAGAALSVTIGRPNLLGILLAGGIVLGIVLFLVITAIAAVLRRGAEDGGALSSRLSLRDRMLMIAIAATIVAHFGEIHTGIAIASTRTHFWILIATLVVVGGGYLIDRSAPQTAPAPASSEPAQQQAHTAGAQAGGTRRQRRQAQAAQMAAASRRAGNGRAFLPTWAHPVIGYGVVLGLILGVLAFDFTNNLQRLGNPGQVFVTSLTELPPLAGVRSAPATSYGMLILFLVTLALGTLIFTSEMHLNGELNNDARNIWPAAGLIAAIAALIWVAFGTFIAGQLVAFITTVPNTLDGVLFVAEQLTGLVVFFYILILVCLLAGAQALRNEEQQVSPPRLTSGNAGWITGLVAIPLALFGISYSNLQPIQADIMYKQAGTWDQRAGAFIVSPEVPIQGWDMAIEHHRRAIQLAPNEDFYYLWLGRALLEKARTHPRPQLTSARILETDSFAKIVSNETGDWGRMTRDQMPSAQLSQIDLLNAAKIILERARSINPLNTDHSANLARMWLRTVSVVTDKADQERRVENSIKEYKAATALSPNNAVLWNEWAGLYAERGDFTKAIEKTDQSLAIDQKFDNTRLIRASVYLRQAEPLGAQRQQALQTIATTPATDTAKIKAANDVIAASTEPWKKLLRQAENELDAAMAINKTNLQTINQLVLINQQLEDYPQAIEYATMATQLNENDWSVWRNLALIYNEAKDKPKALESARRALAIAPADQQAALQAFIQQLGG